MLKSHDSGIRSGDSCMARDDDSHDSSMDSPRLCDSGLPSNESTLLQAGHSPHGQRRRTPALGLSGEAASRQRRHKLQQQQQQLSLAQPYQQIAQHLTYSQVHQQFILHDVGEPGCLPEGIPVTSSSEESGPEEDDVLFADDEDGHTPPDSSFENLARTSSSQSSTGPGGSLSGRPVPRPRKLPGHARSALPEAWRSPREQHEYLGGDNADFDSPPLYDAPTDDDYRYSRQHSSFAPANNNSRPQGKAARFPVDINHLQNDSDAQNNKTNSKLISFDADKTTNNSVGNSAKSKGFPNGDLTATVTGGPLGIVTRRQGRDVGSPDGTGTPTSPATTPMNTESTSSSMTTTAGAGLGDGDRRTLTADYSDNQSDSNRDTVMVMNGILGGKESGQKRWPPQGSDPAASNGGRGVHVRGSSAAVLPYDRVSNGDAGHLLLTDNGGLDSGRDVSPGSATGPGGHRPQSMVVNNGGMGGTLEQSGTGGQQSAATMNRASKSSSNGCSAAVGVSRSSSSLTKDPSSIGSLPFPDNNLESYAHDNIDRHKKGFFRKRQSIQTMLSWTRESINKPLILTNEKDVKKDAVEVYRRIQAYMGDRKVKAGLPLDSLALEVCVKGWGKAGLRDEIYIQLCKQTTDNPRPESLRRGWELIAICLTFFPPSNKFHSYLDSYISRNSDPVLDIAEVPVSHYAQHCAKKLEKIVVTGVKRGVRKPNREEIEQARVQIFHPSMFGNSLDEIMRIQSEKFPSRKIPWIQTSLSEMVLELGGARTEGIFRVPGDIDEVNALKVRMDQWLVPPINDPHVPASLLKLWYRELDSPLIPESFYDECLNSAEDWEKAVKIVDRLPHLNRLVLSFLILFLQRFIRPESVAETKMDSANLAMVMAPNCLRCQSDDPRIIFENTRREMAFMKTLMDNYDPSFMEGVS